MGSDIWKKVGSGRWVGTDSSERFPVYTRGNAGEVYPEVFTPLSFSIASQAAEKAMRAGILSTGLIGPEELEPIPVTTAIGSGVFGGYAYLNLSAQRVAAGRVPGGVAEDADVSLLGVGEPPPHDSNKLDKNFRAGIRGLRCVWRTINDDGSATAAELRADQRVVDEYLASLPEAATAADHELRRSSTNELIPMFAQLFETHVRITVVAGLAVSVLTNLCEKQLDDPNLAVQLLAGLGEVDSAAPSIALWGLGRQVAAHPELSAAFDDGVDQTLRDRIAAIDGSEEFTRSFEDFLAEFGARGPNEWDTAFDTWGTDPTMPLALIDRMRLTDESHDPSNQLERLTKDRKDLEQATLARVKRPLRGIFAKTLASAQRYSQYRERSKTTVVRAIHGARLQAMELDRRLVERAQAAGVAAAAKGDLWFLLDEEVEGYVEAPEAVAETIAERRATHALLSERIPPFFFKGTQPPLEEWELRTATRKQVEAGEVLTGLPGCLGVARGRARVVTNPADPGGMEPGDVLVAPLTDPSWTPLFVPAEAVVVDVGAVMSHAIIVSRELGIPCAVSVTDATKRIPDGALIEVDGSAGTVTIIELPD